MKKNVIVLMIVIVISKLATFAKDLVLSYYYGASEISDAYMVSLAIPIVVFGVIGTSIATEYTPIYSEIMRDQGLRKVVRFSNNLINVTLICCTVITLVVLLFTEKVVLLFASGFNNQTMSIAITFTRISIIGIYSIATFYIFETFLYQNGNFSASVLTSLPVNLIIILAVIVSSKTDILILSIGSVFAVMLQTLLLLLFSLSNQYRYQFVLDFKDLYLKRMILLMLPIIIGSSTHQINQIIERTIASHLAVGGITALSYAQKLVSFLKDVFILSFATVLYPRMSKMAAEGHMNSLRNSITSAVDCICILIIPSTIGIMIFSKPIVEMLFLRGAFNEFAATMTSESLFFYSLGMTAIGIRSIFVKALYSLNDVKTPVISSVISIGFNILLNIILASYLGIGGLALASSISAFLAMILLYINVRKKIGLKATKKSAAVFIKVLIVSLGMGLAAKQFFEMLKNIFIQNISLVLSVCFGVALYIAAISMVNIDTVDDMKNTILLKIKNILAGNSSDSQYPVDNKGKMYNWRRVFKP